MKHKRALLNTFLAAAATLISGSALAASSNWIGGDGNWSGTTNWGGTAWNNGNSAVFGGTAGTVTVDQSATATAVSGTAALTFNTTDYYLKQGTGGSLTLTGINASGLPLMWRTASRQKSTPPCSRMHFPASRQARQM